MKEERGSYNIENQEAKRDIINVFGDNINNHQIIKEQVDIPSIQSVLKKDEIKEGKFFRKKGPVWVDYEQGFIVERKEVKEIINRLENGKVLLAVGKHSSGKSIILKNVGYKLANENKKVHVIELIEHPLDKIKLFFENIPKIDDEEPIFIVDDAHLYLSYCEVLATEFKSKGKGNLIIGSRETREITEEHPKYGAKYQLLSELSKTGIHVQAEDVTEGMIRTFLVSQDYFDEDKIKNISSNLDEFKKDLWLLSWALDEYNKDKKSANIEKIYEDMALSIVDINVGKDKKRINAENVFLPLSIFYRFEIPIEKYFLEEQLSIDENIIIELIKDGDITGKNEMISLYHPSDAELYFQVYQRCSRLGREIKKTILNGKDEEDLEYSSFYLYLTTYPRNVVEVMIHLGDWRNKKCVETLIKKLVDDENIQKSIEKGLRIEKDIGKIGKCISAISYANMNVGQRLVDSLDIISLSTKIRKEQDMGKIKGCISAISFASKEKGQLLVDSIGIDAFFIDN